MSRPIRQKRMREIKFRGKQTAYHRPWIYGSLLMLDGKAYILDDGDTSASIDPPSDPESGTTYVEGLVEVDPNTIGQYTGLKDSEGNEIYEGDLVSVQGLPLGDRRSKVEYIERGGAFFCTSSLSREYLFVANTRGTVNVIGNIHDNPELLER